MHIRRLRYVIPLRSCPSGITYARCAAKIAQPMVKSDAQGVNSVVFELARHLPQLLFFLLSMIIFFINSCRASCFSRGKIARKEAIYLGSRRSVPFSPVSRLPRRHEGCHFSVTAGTRMREVQKPLINAPGGKKRNVCVKFIHADVRR